MSSNKQILVQKKGYISSRQRSRLLETIIGLGGGAFVGLLTALFMPYGPLTATQVWIVMISTLAIGLIAGLVMRTPWAMLLTPLAYVVLFELFRPEGLVPTVGAIRLDNPYGVLALLVGRGFHGLIGVLPMIVGAGVGVLFSQYQSRTISSHFRAFLQATPLVILGIVVVVLFVLNGIPARTPPIIDGSGELIPGSIAELSTISLGGQPQTIMIRAQSADLPVLLYLSGGPGQSDLPYSRVLLEDLTQDFVIVSWDQRGTGKSYPALYPTKTLTLEQAVSDTIELTNYLRQRFDEEKIYLIGESWGTTLGVLAAQQRPDLYYAWIGSGQMVSQRETDRRLYQDVLDMAEQTGNRELKQQMLAFGEPPYADIPYPNAVVMGQYDALGEPYQPPADYIERGTAANLGPWGVFGSEYNLVEKVNVLRGLIDMFTVMYPQLQEIDFRQDVPSLDVPVYILDGAAELAARRDLALAWYDQLNAPIKKQYTFANAGHSVAFEQFSALHQILTEEILPETYPDQ